MIIKKTDTRHGEYFILKNDLFISRCLDVYGEWNESEMLIYNTFIKKEHVVIEVGSHIGSFTVPIAKLAASVFSFEPQRTVFQVLNANLMNNHIHNVYSYMHAVGSENKDIWLREVDYEHSESGFNSGGIKLKDTRTGEQNGYPCRQIRLDDFIPKDAPVKFIKVDAEEMEIDVLKGATGIIKTHRPLMYLESSLSNKELPEYVYTLGYQVYEHIPKNFNENNYKNYTKRLFGFDPNVEYMHDYMLLCIPNEYEFKTNLKKLK